MLDAWHGWMLHRSPARLCQLECWCAIHLPPARVRRAKNGSVQEGDRDRGASHRIPAPQGYADLGIIKWAIVMRSTAITVHRRRRLPNAGPGADPITTPMCARMVGDALPIELQALGVIIPELRRVVVDLRGVFVAYLCVTVANGAMVANTRMIRHGRNWRLHDCSARASASATPRLAPRRALPEQPAAKTHLRAVALIRSGRARVDDLIQPPGSLCALRAASAAALYLVAFTYFMLPARPHHTYVCHLRGDERVGSPPHRLRGLVGLMFATCVVTSVLVHRCAFTYFMPPARPHSTLPPAWR